MVWFWYYRRIVVIVERGWLVRGLSLCVIMEKGEVVEILKMVFILRGFSFGFGSD